MRWIILIAFALPALASAAPIKIAAIPDTQGYSSADHRLINQVEFGLTDTSFSKTGVDAMIALGDCVDDGDAGAGGTFSRPGDNVQGDLAWPFIAAGYEYAIKQVPFLATVGNHDLQATGATPDYNCYYSAAIPCDLEWWSEHVGIVSGIYENRGWFMGWMPDQPGVTYYTNGGGGVDAGDGGHGANAWIQVDTEHGPMGIISLGWIGASEMYDWVESIVDANPSLPFVVIRHRGLERGGVDNDDCNDQMAGVWAELFDIAPNIFLVLNGHSIQEKSSVPSHVGTGFRCHVQEDNASSLAVLRSGFNYQVADQPPFGLNGYARMRIISIDVENDQVCWKTRKVAVEDAGWDTDDGNELCVTDMDLQARFRGKASMSPGVTVSGGAQIVAGTDFTPPAAGLDPGDLNVPIARICETDISGCDGDTIGNGFWWQELDIPDTSTWSESTIVCGGDGCSYTEIKDAMTAATSANEVIIIPNEDGGNYTMAGGSAMSLRGSNTVLRCEDGVVLDFADHDDTSVCDCAVGGSQAQICLGTCTEGTPVNWTASYDRGVTEITVASIPTGLSNGDFIQLSVSSSTDCTERIPVSTHRHAEDSGHIVQVESFVDAGASSTITFDSPLRFDYAQCSGQKIVERFDTYSTQVGIENCEIKVPATNPGPSFFKGVIELGGHKSWMSGVTLSQGYDCFATLGKSKNAMVIGNDFTGSQVNQNQCSHLDVGHSTDFVVENNYFVNADQHSYIHHGAEGVWAYNYHAEGSGGNRGPFSHGYDPREMLIEGNIMEDVSLASDVQWGPNGAIVYYRNRLEGVGQRVDSLGYTPLTGAYTVETGSTFIANAGQWFTGGNCAQTEPSGDFNICPQIDDANLDFWMEYSFCHGGAIGSDCIQLNPDADTSCGTGFGICSYDGTAQSWNRNQMNVDVADLTAVAPGWDSPTIPVSLYRQTEPDWWCSEACSWGTDGIGALGDNFGGTLCQLPAEIRAAAGACTCSHPTMCD